MIESSYKDLDRRTYEAVALERAVANEKTTIDKLIQEAEAHANKENGFGV